MADYREISQEYAQGGIKAVMLLNGGAAIAILTQLSTLPKAMAGAILTSMVFWAIGTAGAAFVWTVVFASTRYVDKSERENSVSHLARSDNLMTTGFVVLLLSLIFFLAGAINLAFGFASSMAA